MTQPPSRMGSRSHPTTRYWPCGEGLTCSRWPSERADGHTGRPCSPRAVLSVQKARPNPSRWIGERSWEGMMTPEANTAAHAAAGSTRSSTKYTYDYDKLPPLAMAGALPDEEAFSARPDWLHLVARSALKLLINTIMIKVRKSGDKIEFVQQVLKKIQDVAQQLGGEAGSGLIDAIAKGLEKEGSRTTLPRLKAGLEVALNHLEETLGIR